MLYGFAPGSTVSLDIRGEGTGFSSTRTVTINRYGTDFSYLGPAWPVDRYSITATGVPPSTGSGQSAPRTTVRVTATKAASLDDEAAR